MQLKQIGRDALLKPLQAVSGIVERRHTLPILANVLLEVKEGRLYVTATDLEMQITAHTDWAGKEAQAITVGARKLQDLLRALPDDTTLNVEASGSKLTVRSGRSRFNLQTLPAADYPRMGVATDRLQTLTLPQRDLRALLRSVEFAMAQQDIRYYLNGMLLVTDKGRCRRSPPTVIGCRGQALPSSGEFERQEVILPRKTVLELGKLLGDVDDPVTLELLASQVRFRFGNVELTSKVVDGKFPDYNRVIPTGIAKMLVLERPQLLATLQRAAILSNEKFRGVRVVLAPQTLKIICTNTEQEEAEEELEVAYRGDPLDIGFNVTTCSTCCKTSAATGAARVRRRYTRARSSRCRSAATSSTS
jgi:DNA polymerase-3 subunit beta